MKTVIWLDDERDPKDPKYKIFLEENLHIKGLSQIYWVRNYEEFVKCLDLLWGVVDMISFDHDLGEEESGLDCAKYLVHKCLDLNQNLPSYQSHSMNPVGKKNILSLLDNYYKYFIKQNHNE